MTDNKRIAKNTIYLYIRTLVVMIVALYTSRLVLQALGETDLGIYNLVGGIVALMAFLQSAQTRATSRFITYELGEGSNGDRMRHVFSSCMTIHIIIAWVILLLAETFGLWIINYWTEIPADRMLAANVVYQFSVLTFVIQFLRVPFDSVIIAHENMSVYAYMSIIEVSLKLLVVFALFRIAYDSLILYGILLCLVAVILFICYRVYLRVKLPMYSYRWTWDSTLSKKILSFSGWTMLGSTTNTATQQGVSLLLNNFVGLVANAALGFATQVSSAVASFVNSFTTAFNPQITKLYAQGDLNSMHVLMCRASKFSFILCYIMALPLIYNMDYILGIWLKDVPQYTTVFCQLILVCSTIDATSGVFYTGIISAGKIKWYQIAISCSFLSDLICSYILLVMGVEPALVFGSRIFTRGFLNYVIGILFAKKEIGFGVINYVKEVMLPILATIAITVAVLWCLPQFQSQLAELFASTALSTIVIVICLWCFILSRQERMQLIGLIKSKLIK